MNKRKNAKPNLLMVSVPLRGGWVMNAYKYSVIYGILGFRPLTRRMGYEQTRQAPSTQARMGFRPLTRRMGYEPHIL